MNPNENNGQASSTPEVGTPDSFGGHRVVWSLETDHVGPQFVCDEPFNGDCRIYCPYGCELVPCAHEEQRGFVYSFSKTCSVVDWLADGDGAEHYDGPTTKPIDGSITPVWDGDGFLWHYAADDVHESAVAASSVDRPDLGLGLL